MRFPFILRSDHEEVVRQSNVIISMLQQQVADMGVKLAKRDKEIDILINEMSNISVDVKVRDKEKKKSVPAILGRGGWRGRSQQNSLSTVPAPKDSAQQLEEKVKREGGTI